MTATVAGVADDDGTSTAGVDNRDGRGGAVRRVIWEYLSLQEQLDHASGAVTWTLEGPGVHKLDRVHGPSDRTAYFGDVLGAHGWELTGIQELQRESFADADGQATSVLIDCKYWFKRPAET